MTRAFEKTEVRQRSFFFVFKYYTVIGQDYEGNDLKPAPWQQYDYRPIDRKSADHIDIAECGSILALSLSGPSQIRPKNRGRRGRVGGLKEYGDIYDTFAPWNLLHIQGFPDYEHSPRSAEQGGRRFPSGPYAFLDALAAEYRDATKRNAHLNKRIAALITPPTRFMFDGKLRDKLLFEDPHFTYSRRYFWAFNTLGVVNDGIKSMVAAYRDTFTDAFWEGRHELLWPHQKPGSEEGQAYARDMAVLRGELERAVEELEDVRRRNETTRKEVVSLREQLFSGSSIKESRKAIEQGDNIKILTSISMIFLPLTFVTVRPNLAASLLPLLEVPYTNATPCVVRLRHYRVSRRPRKLAVPRHDGVHLRPVHSLRFHLADPHGNEALQRLCALVPGCLWPRGRGYAPRRPPRHPFPQPAEG